MVLFGLLLGLVGTDIYYGCAALHAPASGTADGIDFVAFAVGVYGIAEILRNSSTSTSATRADQHGQRLLPTRDDLRARRCRSCAAPRIGSMLGILPGGGTALASFGS